MSRYDSRLPLAAMAVLISLFATLGASLVAACVVGATTDLDVINARVSLGFSILVLLMLVAIAAWLVYALNYMRYDVYSYHTAGVGLMIALLVVAATSITSVAVLPTAQKSSRIVTGLTCGSAWVAFLACVAYCVIGRLQTQ